MGRPICWRCAWRAAAAAEADAAGIWCVRADDAAASRAWTPASGQAGDVRVGVLSGDPRHSAGIRAAFVGALTSAAAAGRFVVRLKGGAPFVFGRGAEELLACLRAGLPVTVVPGVSSAIAVPGTAGVPLTHRGVAQEFHVISAHVPPGDERSTVNWAALGSSRATLVLLMATEHLTAITDALMRHGRDPKSPVSVIADGTLPTQRKITATLDTVAHDAAEAGIRPPAVVVVGEVVTIAAQIAELCSSPANGSPGGTFLPAGRPAQVNGPAHGNDLVRRPAQ